MRHQPEQRIDVHARAFQGLMRLEQDVNKQAKYLDFIDIYSRLSDNEQQRYKEKYPKEVKMMSNFAQRYQQQGLEKGLQQGMQQGMQQGESVMLLRQIEAKFGVPTADIKQRVEAADSADLLQWSERILKAQSIDELWH
jgi:flagellar biosynthesis/type III secretory pathway protein FliH